MCIFLSDNPHQAHYASGGYQVTLHIVVVM
uniref:Uncharacterized protein n=1 Tax=Arundo donax TaxID=35708 RepID=A0A0A9GW34_ARUDO